MKLSTLARTLASALLATGLVAGSLQLGPGQATQASAAPPLAPYYQDDELPAYPNSLEFPLGEALAVNGLPVRISHFTTGDGAQKVRDFYLQSFADVGAPSQVRHTSDGGFVVSATVGGGASQAVVVISPRKDETEVFPSVFPMTAQAADAVNADGELPFSDHAVGIVKVADKAVATGTALTWQEPLMTVSQTAAFLKDELPRRGWTVTDYSPRLLRGSALVKALKGERGVSFHVTPYRFQPKGASVMAQYQGRAEGE